MPITDPFKRKEYARLSMAIKKAREENRSQEIINQLFAERKKILQFIPEESINGIKSINEGINQKEGISGINNSESIKSINGEQFIPKKDFIPENGINGIKSEFIPKTEKSLQPKKEISEIILQPKIEQELFQELEPNNLTQEEKQIALKVIRTITNKNPRDKNLIINYHILYSNPSKTDKDGIITKLKEEAKINRKITTEYMFLKENYFGQIVQLKKTNGRT